MVRAKKWRSSEMPTAGRCMEKRSFQFLPLSFQDLIPWRAWDLLFIALTWKAWQFQLDQLLVTLSSGESGVPLCRCSYWCFMMYLHPQGEATCLAGEVPHGLAVLLAFVLVWTWLRTPSCTLLWISYECFVHLLARSSTVSWFSFKGWYGAMWLSWSLVGDRRNFGPLGHVVKFLRWFTFWGREHWTIQ